MIRYQKHANEQVIKIEFKWTRKQGCAEYAKLVTLALPNEGCISALYSSISVTNRHVKELLF